MKKILPIFFLIFLSETSLLAQKFPVDTLLFNGNTTSRVNFVIIGDGYLASQQGTFLQDARNITNDLFRSSPFTEYKDYFNVFTISVPSNEEGAADDPSALIDNYFGSTFNFAGIRRLLVPTRTNQIINVMADNIPDYDQVMVVVNESEYGGSGGQFATSSTNAAASEISIHEIGHSFAGLADEYWAGAQYARERPNMTRESNEDMVKWKNWTADRSSQIGTYPHSTDPSWYKPHLDCKMQFLGSEFCAVCTEQLIQSIYERIAHVTSFSPESLDTAEGVIQFELTTVQPDPNTLNISWEVDDEEVANDGLTFELNINDLTAGDHEVTAIVYDSTDLDRSDLVYITSVEWELSSGITSTVRNRRRNRPADEQNNVVTSISSNLSDIALKLYPNPTSDLLHFTYHGKSNGEVALSVRELNGKLLLEHSYQVSVLGQVEEVVDIAALPAGIYLVAIDSGKFQKTFRVRKGQ
ncbi:MAG: M64 family metallopeptidase [Bacteroidota bacterium]